MRNPNFDAITDNFRTGKRGMVLEGSSRSGKTWAGLYFLIYYCSKNTGKSIIIVKETYNSFKTTIYEDLSRILDKAGINNPFTAARDVPSFWLLGNKVSFLGADQPSKFHGAGSDMFFINEALDVRQEIFDQLEMRCRGFWWMDYNPKVTDHWIYNTLEKRPDVLFYRSTYKDNPAISVYERRKIESYEPTPANIAAGTADDYMWKVYGLGERCSQTGLVFPNINWITAFPEEVERIWYGLDFGYTIDPTALVKVGINGNDLFLEEQMYSPIDNGMKLAELIEPIVGKSIVWCDSSDQPAKSETGGMVADLQKKHIRAFKVKKWSGSINYGIDVMKRFRLNIVRTPNFYKEAINYGWRTIHGIQVNEPIDDFNHLWDASRYACQMELAKRAGFTV